MSEPERFGDLAAVILARTWHHQPPGGPMTTTATRGACLHHPHEPGTDVMPAGTWRCQPCRDEPRVLEWTTAGHDQKCPGCTDPIKAGDLMAVLDTEPRTTVCRNCIDY